MCTGVGVATGGDSTRDYAQDIARDCEHDRVTGCYLGVYIYLYIEEEYGRLLRRYYKRL